MVWRPLDDWGDVGQRVADARVDEGMTQSELAAAVGLDRTALAKLENGRRNLTALELSRLAQTLGRPLEWFVSAPPPSVVSRRSTEVAKRGALDLAVELFARDVELLLELDVLHPPPPWVATVPTSLEECEQLALAARDHLGLEDGPLLGLDEIVERGGMYAASLNGDERVDGVYVALDGAGAAVINGVQPTGRRRFALAHEFGHHLIADEYATDIDVAADRDSRERLINAFAIHFLMPRPSVKACWRSYRGDDDPRNAAIHLAQEFRVSWSAVCSQLANLELLDKDDAAVLRKRPPSRSEHFEVGGMFVEELTAPRVSPEFAKAVLKALRSQKIAEGRAVELLRGMLTADDFPIANETPLNALLGEFDV